MRDLLFYLQLFNSRQRIKHIKLCFRSSFFSQLFLLFLLIQQTYAFPLGLQVSYGSGRPDQLDGYRISLQRFLPVLFPHYLLQLRGYWDISYANWQVKRSLSCVDQPRLIHILAVSPVLRLQSRENWLLFAQPYLELGVGISLLSKHHLGHRDLGGQFAFQDLIGVGLRWNKVHSWSLSYHYLHYSNASLFPPNQGIDVKHLFTLGYEF